MRIILLERNLPSCTLEKPGYCEQHQAYPVNDLNDTYTIINLPCGFHIKTTPCLTEYYYQQVSGVLAPADVSCITVQSPLFVVVSVACGPPATAVAVKAKAFTSAESIDKT